MPVNSEKLHKVLAQAGLGSRRAMEQVIAAGEVSINGKIAVVGDRVTSYDKIYLKGQLIQNPLQQPSKTRVLMYHKPEGEVCSTTDEENRPTVYAKLPRLRKGRWIMIGRLDINTSGLLLFTNNGELANRLMHPKYAIEREYAVRILGTVDDVMLKQLREGVLLDDGPAKFDHIIFAGGEGANSWYHVVLHEGRNREVRRLWETQGVKVSRLARVRYGIITLPRYLRTGYWKELEWPMLQKLSALVELKSTL